MKTLITTIAIATSSTAATAHTCGIPDLSLIDYPGYAVDGPVYDRGDYLFTSDTERHANGDSYTSHVRIYKDDCSVSVVTVFHPGNGDAPIVTTTDDNAADDSNDTPADSRVVTSKTKYIHKGFKGNNKTMVIRDITVTKDGSTTEITRRVVTDKHGRKTVTVDNHTDKTAVKRKFKIDGSLKSKSQVDYKADRKVNKNWVVSSK